MKTAMKLLIGFVVVGLVAWFVIANYSWVFAKNVKGKIVAVERVTEQSAILGRGATDAQMHTYSILIEGDDGIMYAASSEASQWQVAKKGYCVEALLYRYPPWRLSLAGTFFNARLTKIQNCSKDDAPTTDIPPATTLPDAAAPSDVK